MNFAEIQKSLLAPLAEKVSGYTFHQINLGISPSKVFQLESENKANLYLKISPRVPAF